MPAYRSREVLVRSDAVLEPIFSQGYYHQALVLVTAKSSSTSHKLEEVHAVSSHIVRQQAQIALLYGQEHSGRDTAAVAIQDHGGKRFGDPIANQLGHLSGRHT